jgi:hypothetical protein
MQQLHYFVSTCHNGVAHPQVVGGGYRMYRICRIAVNTLNQQSYSKRLGTTTLFILELTLRNIMRYCFLTYFNEASFCTCWTQLITSIQLLEIIRVSMHLIVTLTHCVCQHGMCVRLCLSHLSVSVNSLSDFDSI